MSGRSASRTHQSGLSLAELLIAMVLGLVLIGGVLGIYLSSRTLFQAQEGLARVQENARFALELMVREIREAGLSPCGSPITANLLQSSTTTWSVDTSAGMLRGGGNSALGVVSTGSGAAQHMAGTDTLLILRAAGDEASFMPITLHEPSSQRFTVSTRAAISDLDLALVCDGRSSALFQVATVQASNQQLSYEDAPLNCTDLLGSVVAPCAQATGKTFMPGGTIAPWNPSFWFIGQNSRGTRSLYRAFARPTAAGKIPPDLQTHRNEMVPGVTDLQIDYLTRDITGTGTLATTWKTAAQMTGLWNHPQIRVAAVRVAITVSEDGSATGNAVSRQFKAVAALRNNGL